MAGKFGTYILTMSGLLVVFYFLGLLDSGFTNSLLNILLNPESLQNSDLALKFTGVIGGVVVGFIALRTAGFTADSALIASMIPLIIGFGWDFLIIFQTINAFSTPLAVLIFSPFMLLWVLTVVEWWRGITT